MIGPDAVEGSRAAPTGLRAARHWKRVEPLGTNETRAAGAQAVSVVGRDGASQNRVEPRPQGAVVRELAQVLQSPKARVLQEVFGILRRHRSTQSGEDAGPFSVDVSCEPGDSLLCCLYLHHGFSIRSSGLGVFLIPPGER